MKGSDCGLKIVSENGPFLYLTCKDIPSTCNWEYKKYLNDAYTFILTNSNSSQQILFLKLI